MDVQRLSPQVSTYLIAEKANENDPMRRFDSDSIAMIPTSQRDFKMIFMSASYSNRNPSNDFRTQNATIASVQLSCRTLQTARVTASLRKALSSMKIHSWKTDYALKDVSSVPIDTADNMFEKVESKQVAWYQEFSSVGPILNDKDIFLYNKLLAKIRIDDSLNDMLGLMLHGVSLFCYNMQYGTTDDHMNLWNRISQARRFASHVKDIPFVFALIPEISYREPMTGKLKRGIGSIVLTTGTKVIVTTDRSYAKRCSKKVIYINFRHQLASLRPPDTIQIGEVSLRVRKVIKLSLECDVLMGGKILPKTEVHLPAHVRPDLSRPSREELEDLTFLIGNGINCMILPIAGNESYLGSIKTALHLFEFDEMHILARVREMELLEDEHAKWIAANYEGVILITGSCPCSEIPLHEKVKNFMKVMYDMQKPIILQCIHNKSCSKGVQFDCRNLDFDYFFYYPDGYYLSDCESTPHLQLVQRSVQSDTIKIIEDIAQQKLSEPFVDKSFSGSDSMARVIAKASYEFNAKAILICSSTGRMAMKVSHFRPKCPIIVLTKNQRVTRYLKVFYNIRIAFYVEMAEAKNLSRSDLLVARLLHGLVHGLSLHIFEHDDVIIFCYKDPADVAFANVMIPFQVDAKTVRGHFESLEAKTK
ncbi:unnamed protein product [Hermetia illucens]|uniref:Pyruvate kinase n=1 Tax=Hermetia illucens TaxID=343691 RepID=A0A7R8UH00_HERIL|nr:pyruvate kinase 2 [Hermetia illucens]CAD7080449.1 unnamed protein product [Hermetia illucens]